MAVSFTPSNSHQKNISASLDAVTTLPELGAILEQVRHACRMSLRDASTAARGTPSHVTIRDWERGLRWPRRDHFTDLLTLAYRLSPPHVEAWVAALERIPHPTSTASRRPCVVHGRPPHLATAYQPRNHLHEQVRQAWNDAVPLRGTLVALVGPGGVGKTQLAAALFSDETETSTLRIWVDASSRDTVISSLAYAGKLTPELQSFAASTGAEWAQHVLYWLAHTSEPWLLVLDNLVDFTALDAIADPSGSGDASRASLWPSGPGRVLITTRYRGPRATAMGVRLIPVSGFTATESKTYLAHRLSPSVVGTGTLPRNTLSGLDALCQQLHHYPLALAHAGATIETMRSSCKDYLDTVVAASAEQHRAAWQDEDLAPHYGGAVGSTWQVAARTANRLHPQGIVLPALYLASVLDPEGIPDDVWTTSAVTSYLQRHATAEGCTVTADDARLALRLLHQVSLVEHHPEGGAAGLRVHAYTQLPVRAMLDQAPSSTDEQGEPTYPTLLEETIAVAAQALMHLWPDGELELQRGARLRANVDALRAHGSPVLWYDDASTVLLKVGFSYLFQGRYVQAIVRLRELADASEALLGPHNPTAVIARNYEISARGWAGEYEEAAEALLATVPDLVERLGSHHYEVVRCRFNAALFMYEAGHVDQARALLAEVFAAHQQARPSGPPDFHEQHRMLLVTIHMLPSSDLYAMYQSLLAALPEMPAAQCPLNLLTADIVYTGMTTPAAFPTMYALVQEAQRDVVARCGREHHASLALTLAVGYFARLCGEFDVAELQVRDVLDTVMARHGSDHHDAVWCRIELAEIARGSGQRDDAEKLLTTLLPSVRDTMGADHPRTLWCRAELALCQLERGATKAALRSLEKVVQEYAAVRGERHPETQLRRRQLHAAQGHELPAPE